MEDLLRPIQTKTVRGEQGSVEHHGKDAIEKITSTQRTTVSTADEALQILQSKPEFEQFLTALHFLDPVRADKYKFNVTLPSPQAAKIVYSLVESIVPAYWPALDNKSRKKDGKNSTRERAVFLRCLSSVTGIGAIVARLRALLASRKDAKAPAEGRPSTQHISDIFQVLAALLKGNEFLWTVWKSLRELSEQTTKRTMIWRELASLLCMGKILSITAEVALFMKSSGEDLSSEEWIGDGALFSAWLGRNIATLSSRLLTTDADAWNALAQIFGKSFSLGYADQVMGEVISGLPLEADQEGLRVTLLLEHMASHESRNALLATLRILPKNYLASDQPWSEDASRWTGDAQNVAGAAALLRGMIAQKEGLAGDLEAWLTGTSTGGVGDGVAVKRAAIAAMSTDEERLHAVFEKSMQQFGDKLHIKHTPILQQEANTQILLLSAGSLYRSNSELLAALGRSSTYLHAISNRLGASSPRSRFLGMIVGRAISELIDKPENKMVFGGEEMDNIEARWYLSLTKANDRIGHLRDLKKHPSSASKPQPVKIEPASQAKPNEHKKETKVISIEEVVDDGNDSEDDEFVPYEKPDSDEEDEEEDATLVSREKATAPVYVRDLINGLRDADNYERQRLALSGAASLIRRKANFGMELTEHAEELATILTGLHDKYDMENFQEHRLQAMIALLVAQPLEMGQWYSKTFFDGDYSIGQRTSVLNALGMGARELAGYAAEDGALTGATTLLQGPAGSFPSKKLPPRLHALFADNQPTGVDALATRLEKTMLNPMAIEAADKLSGPNALKVRTFSSRMAVEAKRPPPKANALSKIVAPAFFFPLTGRWFVHVQAFGASTPHSSPHLLSMYLKTLALILHASGPSTTSLPQITSELWDLLLALRSHPTTSSDPLVLEALLFTLLTLLNAHTDTESGKRRLAESHARELVETREWTEQVFENASGQGEEGERVRMLAAGVLVRVREVVEKWQRLMVGDVDLGGGF